MVHCIIKTEDKLHMVTSVDAAKDFEKIYSHLY